MKTLDLIEEYESSGRFKPECFKKQKDFAMKRVPDFQVDIEEFNFCTISVLKKLAVFKVIRSCEDSCSATLIYEMSNCHQFELIATPGVTFHTFDVITRFGCDPDLQYALGKKDEERVFPKISKHKRDAY